MSFKTTEAKKLLVWTWTDIHNPSGTPAILITLFNLLPTWEVLYICGKRSKSKQLIERAIRVKHYDFIDKIDILTRGNWVINLLLDFSFKIPLLTILCAYNIARAKPQKILTILFNRNWILSLYLSAKIFRKEIIVYVHDPFKEKFLLRNSFERKLMFYLEKKVLSDKAIKIVVLNEGLENLYKVYQKPIVLPNIYRNPKEAALFSCDIPNNTLFKIAFSGSVYENNRELVYSLVDIVKHRTDCELSLFGKYGKKDLSYFQSAKNVSIHFSHSQELLFKELLNYDLLYLPLSFIGHRDLPIECLQPVFPTKALDYISTNRPILLHCPQDFSLAFFLKTHKIGYWLHSGERSDLEKTLNSLITERGRVSLSYEEYEKVMHEFSIEKNLPILNSLLAW